MYDVYSKLGLLNRLDFYLVTVFVTGLDLNQWSPVGREQ